MIAEQQRVRVRACLNVTGLFLQPLLQCLHVGYLILKESSRHWPPIIICALQSVCMDCMAMPDYSMENVQRS